MNEIKRQLNMKIGDTSERTQSIIQKVEERKKMKRRAKKSSLGGPIYIAIASVVTVLALYFLLSSLQNDKENHANIPSPTPTENIDDTETQLTTKEVLRKYFKPDGTVAYFEGFGNEYAKFTETTKWITPDYVEILVDNGGGVTQKIYRITDDAIELLINRMAEDGVVTPFVEELLTLKPISTTLKGPFEEGLTFDDQTMHVDVPLKTLYGEFSTILVEYEEEGTTVSKYYAKQQGLVAEIYTFSDNIKVESYLASVNEPPVTNIDGEIEVYNESLQKTEMYAIKDLPFVDPNLLELNPDYYSMTYRKLIGTNVKDLGVLTYSCNNQEQCTHVFVAKKGNDISVIAHVWHSYGNAQLSPDQQTVAIPIAFADQSGGSYIERNQILLIDLDTFTQIIPASEPQYFDSTMYPIVSFKLTNQAITLEVADISSFDHEDIAAWQKQSPQPTKEITVKIK